MLKVSRGDAGLRSPVGETLSPQRKRNRRSAAASDSLASLVMPTESNFSMIQPSSTSSSTRKKLSKHKHRATPSSLEQISRTAAATPFISAEKKSSAAAAHFKTSYRHNKSTSPKVKHSGKRASKSGVASSSLLTVGMGKHNDSNDNNNASPQKKQNKKKREISPRSKSKLESLVTHIPQGIDTSNQTEQNQPKEHEKQQQKSAAPIAKGSLVMVQPRTWPGMNKLGGVGRITAVHSSTAYDLDSPQQQQQNNNQKKGGPPSDVIDASTTVTYDVSYVLGGKDKNIEAEYVSLHDTNQEAPRERHQRVPITKTLVKKGKEEHAKKKEVKKRKKVNLSSTTRARASSTKKKEAGKKRNDPNINPNTRGKQLKQLHKVRDEKNSLKTAKEEEEEPSADNLKSPAFSLSSQFSNQDETFSPLDYLADSYPKIDTPILQKYTEKWSDGQQQQSQQHPEQNLDEALVEERADDPSSSVVSTDEDGSELTPPPPQRRNRDLSIRISRRNAKLDMSPPSENKSLELEYGRLALKKQEIERRMKMYKSDAESINPWASTLTGENEHLETSSSASFGQAATDGSGELERRPRNVTYGNTLQYPMPRYDGGMPSQEDVEFGEMVYRRNMADRQRDRYSRLSKPKKKRRRRVVETITRVIHEESEDDGSSISDRQLLSDARYGRSYSDDHDYMSQKFDRRRGGRSDYLEFTQRSRDRDSTNQHSKQRGKVQGFDSRKEKYPEQAASNTRKKTKSRPVSALEDLD